MFFPSISRSTRMDLADGEVHALPVADRAGLAKRRGHLESVSRGILAIVTAQASRSSRGERRVEEPRYNGIGQTFRQWQLIGITHMALGTVAPVAGEKLFIVIARYPAAPDRKVVLQFMPRVDAVNDVAELDRLQRGLVCRPATVYII